MREMKFDPEAGSVVRHLDASTRAGDCGGKRGLDTGAVRASRGNPNADSRALLRLRFHIHRSYLLLGFKRTP